MLQRDQSLFTVKTWQQRHCIRRIFTYRPSIDILYYPEERKEEGELIKAGHYVLLRRATPLSQPENEKVYSLVYYVAVLIKVQMYLFVSIKVHWFFTGFSDSSWLWLLCHFPKVIKVYLAHQSVPTHKAPWSPNNNKQNNQTKIQQSMN